MNSLFCRGDEAAHLRHALNNRNVRAPMAKDSSTPGILRAENLSVMRALRED
jgi:hypothetical protein